MPEPTVIPTDSLPEHGPGAVASVDGTTVYVRASLTGAERDRAVWKARLRAFLVRQERRSLRTLAPGAAFRWVRRSVPHAVPATAAASAVAVVAAGAFTIGVIQHHGPGRAGSRPVAAAFPSSGGSAGRGSAPPRGLRGSGRAGARTTARTRTRAGQAATVPPVGTGQPAAQILPSAQQVTGSAAGTAGQAIGTATATVKHLLPPLPSPSPLPTKLPVPVPSPTVTAGVKVCVQWLLGVCMKWKITG